MVLAAAEEHYQPGTFTTIPAFEWSAAPKGGNLHRNVFFRDTNVPERPMSYVDINREEELWAWMAEPARSRACSVIAIPHNSNASKGMMFAPPDSKGDPIDLEYAEMRSRFEPPDRDDADQGQLGGAPVVLGGGRVRQLRERRLASGTTAAGISRSSASRTGCAGA